MRAYVRYYLKYTPDTINSLSLTELAECFMDIVFVRKNKNPNDAED